MGMKRVYNKEGELVAPSFNIKHLSYWKQYAFLVFYKDIYSKLPIEDLYHIKHYHKLEMDDYDELEDHRRDFIQFFDKISKRDFNVDLIELFSLWAYHDYFFNETNFRTSITPVKQFRIIIDRLFEIYSILKEVDFSKDRIEYFMNHRHWRMNKTNRIKK